MRWGGYTEGGAVMHGLTDEGRAACGVTLETVLDVPPDFLADLATCRKCRAAERGRPVYVYRLKVETPEGVDWRNPPKDWTPMTIDGPEGQDIQAFRWPARRHYMSRVGAEDRARLLRSWGCTVTIERSEPVEWAK